MWGASPPTDLKAFQGARGRPDFKNAPKQVRLPSGIREGGRNLDVIPAVFKFRVDVPVFVFGLLAPGLGPGLPGTRACPVLALCYAIVLPGRTSGFRAGFRPESSRESLKIGPPAGEVFLIGVWPNSARKLNFWPGKHYCVT